MPHLRVQPTGELLTKADLGTLLSKNWKADTDADHPRTTGQAENDDMLRHHDSTHHGT